VRVHEDRLRRGVSAVDHSVDGRVVVVHHLLRDLRGVQRTALDHAACRGIRHSAERQRVTQLQLALDRASGCFQLRDCLIR
jgi:hypothetical protein